MNLDKSAYDKNVSKNELSKLHQALEGYIYFKPTVKGILREQEGYTFLCDVIEFPATITLECPDITKIDPRYGTKKEYAVEIKENAGVYVLNEMREV